MLVSKNTGWQLSSALSSLKRRYKTLKKGSGQTLNFGLVSAKSSQNIVKAISNLSHGEYLGFASKWWSLDFSGLIKGKSLRFISGHVYSLHAVKEGETTHFIYVNRGERHYNKDGSTVKENAAAVMVFSVGEKDAQAFAGNMMRAAKSFNPRVNMSKFLNDNQGKINLRLSEMLSKSDQKTGNCTVANSNIAWHFQLASDAMRLSALNNQEPPISFADAYAETKSIYKQMRASDRVEAFKYLLNDKSAYLSERAYFYNCMQVLEKFAVKDQKNNVREKNVSHIQSLVDSADNKTLNKLMNLLLRNDFSKNIEQYIDERIKKMQKDAPNITNEEIEQYRQSTTNNLYISKDKVLGHALKKAPDETQKKMINNDISLLRHATPEIQGDFLQQDFNKYALHASDDVKNKILTDQPKDVANKEGIESKYLDQSTHLSRERKTSTNGLLLSSAGLKEMDINNKLRFLYSYAAAAVDEKQVSQAFKALCLHCCKRRIYLSGGAYSADTRSAHWLIERLSAEDDTGIDLRRMLNIDRGGVKEKVENIVASQNTALPDQLAHYKRRLHAFISTEKPDASKLAVEYNLSEEKAPHSA